MLFRIYDRALISLDMKCVVTVVSTPKDVDQSSEIVAVAHLSSEGESTVHSYQHKHAENYFFSSF